MAILLPGGDILHRRLVKLRDKERCLYGSIDLSISPDHPAYSDCIVWLPPRDQARATALARKALLARLANVLSKLVG